jgi:hypothetical protein
VNTMKLKPKKRRLSAAILHGIRAGAGRQSEARPPGAVSIDQPGHDDQPAHTDDLVTVLSEVRSTPRWREVASFLGVRRCKAALFQWMQAPSGTRSSSPNTTLPNFADAFQLAS